MIIVVDDLGSISESWFNENWVNLLWFKGSSGFSVFCHKYYFCSEMIWGKSHRYLRHLMEMFQRIAGIDLVIKLIDIWKQQQPITENSFCHNNKQKTVVSVIDEWYLLKQHNVALDHLSLFSVGYNGDKIRTTHNTQIWRFENPLSETGPRSSYSLLLPHRGVHYSLCSVWDRRGRMRQ